MKKGKHMENKTRISIKDYAKSKNVSYEAIRSQIKRFSKELDKHIYKIKKTRYLDEYAINFLDERRKDNPIIILEENKEEEIQRLKQENENLKSMLLQTQNKIISLQEEKTLYLEEKAKYNLLLDQKEKQDEEIKELKEDIQDKEKELSRYHKTILGLYKKEKIN